MVLTRTFGFEADKLETCSPFQRLRGVREERRQTQIDRAAGDETDRLRRQADIHDKGISVIFPLRQRLLHTAEEIA